MKLIGLIGGMSWESTVTYYQLLNRMVAERFGGFSSARLLLYSVDFAEIEACQASGQWDESGEILADAALSLEAGGADCILLCTNTMHKVADAITSATSLPFIHIVDALAESIQAAGIQKVGLLGTKFTMAEPFYREKLKTYGIEVLTPDEAGQNQVNEIIFGELCLGVIKDESKTTYLETIRSLAERGAQGIILGCTEIGLLVSQEDLAELPVFDTTLIHAQKAFDFATEEAV